MNTFFWYFKMYEKPLYCKKHKKYFWKPVLSTVLSYSLRFWSHVEVVFWKKKKKMIFQEDFTFNSSSKNKLDFLKVLWYPQLKKIQINSKIFRRKFDNEWYKFRKMKEERNNIGNYLFCVCLSSLYLILI